MDTKNEISAAWNLIRALSRRGVEHVFSNAGTDHAPIVEALVAMRASGEPTPEFHVVPHENLAISMAQGYYGVSGKPAVVLVHVTVGTANAICGLMNARRSFATPSTRFRARPSTSWRGGMLYEPSPTRAPSSRSRRATRRRARSRPASSPPSRRFVVT